MLLLGLCIGQQQLTHQSKFLKNFMVIFENLLMFIRALRQGLWSLHLQSLHHLSKYFFAFDLQNYVRLTPLYLAQMVELKDHHPETWAFLQANFSVNKSNVPFSAIGADHALEQENRAMKVMGGIKGIANKASTIEKHFLDLPETNNIIDCFNEQFGFQRNVRDEHYQLTGGTNYRVINNATRLMDVNNATRLMDVNNATRLMDVNNATRLMDVNNATRLMDVNNATRLMDVNNATRLMDVNNATRLMDVNNATRLMDVNNATRLMDVNNATRLMDVNNATRLMDVNNATRWTFLQPIK